VDVGAKGRSPIIDGLAAEGTAVLVVTSDLPEALRIADRLLVVGAAPRSPSSAGDASRWKCSRGGRGATRR